MAKQLNAVGRRTKRVTAKNGNVSGGKKWAKDAVLRVLKNGVYAGFMPYGDELHEAEHEAIIDREKFKRIGAALDRKQKSGRRYGNNPEYLLRGILRCGNCDSAMTPASTRKKGKVYRYYRCVQRDKRGAKECDVRQIPASAIEDFVVDRIRNESIGGALSKQIVKSLETSVENKRQELKIERGELPKQIAKLSDEGRRLVDKVASMNGTAAKLMENRINEVGEQLGQAESRLRQVEWSLMELDRAEAEGKWLAESVEKFDTVWETMTPMNRVRLVSILVKSVTMNEKEDTVTAVLTDLFADEDQHEGNDPPERFPANTAVETTV